MRQLRYSVNRAMEILKKRRCSGSSRSRIESRRASRIGFIFTAVLLAFSCTTTGPKEGLVHIRINNQSGIDFDSVLLGSRIIKPNSYSNTTYETIFKSIDVNEVTEYQSTRGKHLGTNRVRAHSKRQQNLKRRQIKIRVSGVSGRKKWSPVMKEFIRVNGGVKSTFKDPYTGSELNGYSLPPGKYTYLFTPASEGSVNLQIVKD